MIIKLTEVKRDIMGRGDDDEAVLYINEALISSIDPDDDGGTWILIPPYQKPIKVKEDINKISRMIK